MEILQLVLLMSIIFLLTLVVELDASESTTELTRKIFRVHAGKDDTAEEFDFTVLLQHLQSKYRFCTASLLSATWVLTAAHCLEDQSIAGTGVRYGDFTTLDTHKVARVIKAFPHPSYSHAHEINDIALLLVEKILGKTYVKLLAVDYKTLFGLPISFAGFGRISKNYMPYDHEDIAEEQIIPLQVGHGIVIPCETYETFKFSVLCVAPKCDERRQQLRSGDRGGPLLYAGRLAGIARSFVKKDGLSISKFTPICLYMGWIKNVMRGEDIINAVQNKTR